MLKVCHFRIFTLTIIIEKVQNYILTMWGEDEGIWKTMPPKERKLNTLVII